MEYDLEINRAVKEIQDSNAKMVCLQLPDGLKPEAKNIVDEIQKQTGAQIMIWLGTCFGACDIPLSVERLGVDLLIQWGHSEFR